MENGNEDRSEIFLKMLSKGNLVRSRGRQRANFLIYPELGDTVWYDTSKFSWVKDFEENYEKIKQEYLSLDDKKFVKIVNSVEGEWKTFNFINQGGREIENCKLCPYTTSLIDNVKSIMSSINICYVYFSKIAPGTHIKPHFGVSNIRIRFQLPLISSKSWMRVDEEKKEYIDGKSFLFDDTYNHEVKNEGDTDRVIFLMDVYHPDLTEKEIEIVKKYLSVQ